MIDLSTWTMPNGRKVSIVLEELGIDYKAIPIDISKGEQHAPDFLAIAPNNRIPAIVDHDNGLCLMESGAIMMSLADKYGRFQVKGAEYCRMADGRPGADAGAGAPLREGQSRQVQMR